MLMHNRPRFVNKTKLKEMLLNKSRTKTLAMIKTRFKDRLIFKWLLNQTEKMMFRNFSFVVQPSLLTVTLLKIRFVLKLSKDNKATDNASKSASSSFIN